MLTTVLLLSNIEESFRKMEKSHYPFRLSLEALNLVDCDNRLNNFLTAQAPKLKLALILLQTLTEECKIMTDRNGVEFDMSRLRHFMKSLPTSLSFERDAISLLTTAKYAFFEKRLLTILKNNIFKDYVSFLKRRLNKCALVEEVENFLRKFLKVCHILPRSLEISDEDVEIYEFMAELLEFCYNVDVQDSHIVISLLKITIDWYTKAIADTRHVRQPVYKQGFLRYILNHSMKARFDLSSFCSKHPAALWDYSRSFSVLNAVAFGNVQRTLTLLQHGVEVFTAGDLEKSGHGFANIPQVIPPRHLLILQMMRMMRSINLFILNAVRSADFGLYSATQDQKRSFEIVWRAIPDPHIKYKEIAVAILKEYCFFERHYVTNPMRYENNWKYLLMYENCFKDVATGPKEPRTLKHLCRCTIRKSLKDAWKLPVGIFQLRLPKILQDYLNLEFD